MNPKQPESTPLADTVALSPWLLPASAAIYLGVTVPTLATWRCKGKGPDFSKAGALVRYHKATLDNWLESRNQRMAR
jgi:hypothetical protein